MFLAKNTIKKVSQLSSCFLQGKEKDNTSHLYKKLSVDNLILKSSIKELEISIL